MGLLLPFPILVDPRLKNVKSRLKIPIRIRGNKFDSKSGSVGNGNYTYPSDLIPYF